MKRPILICLLLILLNSMSLFAISVQYDQNNIPEYIYSEAENDAVIAMSEDVKYLESENENLIKENVLKDQEIIQANKLLDDLKKTHTKELVSSFSIGLGVGFLVELVILVVFHAL